MYGYKVHHHERDKTMLDEFKRRLLMGETPGMIAQDMTDRLQSETKRRQAEIDKNKMAAEYIMTGLRTPSDSIPHQIAEAFIKQFEAETGMEMVKKISERLAEAGKDEKQ